MFVFKKSWLTRTLDTVRFQKIKSCSIFLFPDFSRFSFKITIFIMTYCILKKIFYQQFYSKKSEILHLFWNNYFIMTNSKRASLFLDALFYGFSHVLIVRPLNSFAVTVIIVLIMTVTCKKFAAIPFRIFRLRFGLIRFIKCVVFNFRESFRVTHGAILI